MWIPLDPAPTPIAWGRRYESVAIQQLYMAHMKKLGHSNISVKKCSFIIHPERGWLGASEDSDDDLGSDINFPNPESDEVL